MIVLNDPPEISIALDSPSDCSVSAQVTFNGSASIPEQFDVEWSTGERSPRIENVQNGELVVMLVDEHSCLYSDTTLIENMSTLSYQLDTMSGSCSGDIPSSANIFVINDPSATVLWNDGSTELSRPELEPGHYQFTLTNDLGCSQIDSLTVSPIGNLDFDVSVTNANCNTQTSGSLEIFTDDPDLLFSIDGVSFTDQRTFESLDTGPLTVYVQNQQACLDSMAINIQHDDTFDSGLSTTITGQLNQALVINPEPIQEDIRWTWSSEDFELSCNDCPSPSLLVDKEGTVLVDLTNGICSTQEIIRIRISLGDEIYIPNVFHPNSTSGNDKFLVYPNASFDELDISIYDRWGNAVYNLNNIPVEDVSELGWDGTFNGNESMTGVYVFKAKVRRFVDNTEIEILGDFMLLR